ncbi:hypothetical protein PENTCL1PPCAC_24059, partial [Pristionchus entomophagus]
KDQMAAVSASRPLYEPSGGSRPSSSSGEESESSSTASSTTFWKEPKDEIIASTLVNTPPSPSEKRPTTTGGSGCAGCGADITDQFIFHVHPDMQYHAACLKCAQCHCYLNETVTAYVRNGQTYCREDYERLFMAKCSRCARHLSNADLVMRAAHHVFHVDCFKCAACERQLRSGDEYVVSGEAIFCRHGCPGFQNQSLTPSLYNEDDSWETSTMTSLDPPVSTSPNFSSPKSEALTPPSSAFPSSVPLPPAQHGMPQCLPPSGLNMGGGGGGGKKSKKDKNNRQATRVRTVLNENQLLILKRCYNNNQRPDAIIKLVEATGLNARVIRVWFQNKRCKDKKRQIAIRDSEVNAQRERVLTNVRMNGVGPFSVASPSAHVVDTLPLEVHHYAQWPEGTAYRLPYDWGFLTGSRSKKISFQNYTDLSGDAAMMHFMAHPHPPPPHFGHQPPPGFSPHIISDLSSPSCSE